MLRAMSTSQRVTANDTMGQLLTAHPGAARVLVDRGMHCVGCAIAPFETIAEACAIYDISVEELFAALDRVVEAERQTSHDGAYSHNPSRRDDV
jgi:hybrid cluster-associated redox disulfide protein